MLTRTLLESPWRLRAIAGPIPHDIAGMDIAAPVPGDVHMALRAAEAIPDPADGDNEHDLAWIGSTDWEYRTRLPRLTDAERVDLVFHGVDTIAELFIDGESRARSRNMHRTWRVPLPELTRGTAEARLLLSAPVPAAEEERRRLGALPSAFSPLAPYLRKKACDFGWDWGPALPGAGIWRRVEIETWSVARLAAVRPTARLRGADGAVELDIEIDRAPSGQGRELGIAVELGGASLSLVVPAEESRVRGVLHVPKPEPWWPAGLGAQTLHELRVELRHSDELLDRSAQAIGFRELVVDQIPDGDGDGCGFGISVNGVPLFIRGFNWIPEDTSIASVTRDDYRRRIDDARDLGANLLRVWGGGVFEDDEFYRACDEKGMLVWQDFLFACAAYPEDDRSVAEVRAEARDNITRIMPHPSLALWNGNNENLWFWFLHGWDELLGGAAWGERYYVDVLPEAVADLDPSRSYLLGSPSSGERWREPNDPTRGVVHWWLPGDYRDYDLVRPRFVSEFGFQGPPARPTFDRVVHDAEPAPFSPGTIQRQKAVGGTERINDVLDVHLGVPADFDEWYWLAQLDQARAVRYGVERFRTLEPYCRGTIVWQLNDCWPSLSWSMIDVDDRWKPAAYAVRAAYADRILVLRMEDGLPALFACNSAAEEWRASATVERWTGQERGARAELEVIVPAGTALRVPLGGLADGLGGAELLVASAEGSRTVLLGGTDRDFPDVPAAYGVEVTIGDHGIEITLTARSILRDTVIAVEEIDPGAHSEENLLTVLPGETATWTVRTRHPERFTREAVRGVLRTARAALVRDERFRGLSALEAP
ncbi:beta-mannosidase [Microbacterium resistens]|uniref:beta-mannosidase n=1 Tax=Microbacterium resistens TaxID=156977 RepID=A0ABU1SCW8_9MICO|nr:glycoside hydrolase family 2 protein [Microbacterium resistens]MDR6867455.1 beta-mannosidase [Microbacterium resistens]